MKIEEQHKLRFKGVSIQHIEVESLKPFDTQTALDLNVQMKPKVLYSEKHRNTFKIILDVKIFDEKIFNLSLLAVGYYELDAELDEKQKEMFINSNSVAIMFPYIRSFITTITSNMGPGIPSIIMPAYFFEGKIEEYKNEYPHTHP